MNSAPCAELNAHLCTHSLPFFHSSTHCWPWLDASQCKATALRSAGQAAVDVGQKGVRTVGEYQDLEGSFKQNGGPAGGKVQARATDSVEGRVGAGMGGAGYIFRVLARAAGTGGGPPEDNKEHAQWKGRY